MKTTNFYLSVLLISISSCTTTYNSYNYSDPNYLKSDEFTSTPVVEEKTIVIVEEYNDVDTISSDENTTINNYYYEDDYDFYYTSRIRRFHRPYYSYGYYGNYYTNSYWYTGNPYHCGTSIYYSYGWNSPYYYGGYNYYDPYYNYYSSYYTPYYYGGHYNNNYHGHYYNGGNTYITNSSNSEFGHRGSLRRGGGKKHLTTGLNTNNINSKKPVYLYKK